MIQDTKKNVCDEDICKTSTDHVTMDLPKSLSLTIAIQTRHTYRQTNAFGQSSCETMENEQTTYYILRGGIWHIHIIDNNGKPINGSDYAYHKIPGARFGEVPHCRQRHSSRPSWRECNHLSSHLSPDLSATGIPPSELHLGDKMYLMYKKLTYNHSKPFYYT